VEVRESKLRLLRGCPFFITGLWRVVQTSQWAPHARSAKNSPPERALVEFKPNSCAVKFAIVPDGLPYAGDLIVALFGDEKPMTAPAGPRAGRELIRVSPRDWSTHATRTLRLKRPIDIAFCPHSKSAYVLDFGEFEITPDKGVAARAGSGSLWKLPSSFMDV
jgi:hypothetical protein